MKLLPSQHKFCVHQATMHQFTVSLYLNSKPHNLQRMHHMFSCKCNLANCYLHFSSFGRMTGIVYSQTQWVQQWLHFAIIEKVDLYCCCVHTGDCHNEENGLAVLWVALATKHRGTVMHIPLPVCYDYLSVLKINGQGLHFWYLPGSAYTGNKIC